MSWISKYTAHQNIGLELSIFPDYTCDLRLKLVFTNDITVRSTVYSWFMKKREAWIHKLSFMTIVYPRLDPLYIMMSQHAAVYSFHL